MYQDVFVEELVVRRPTAKTILAKTGLVILGILVLLLIFWFIPAAFSLAFLLVIFALYLLLRRMNRGYEYSFTNGDLDVDQISAKRWRKRMLEVNADKILVMAPYTAEYEGEAKAHSISKASDFSSSANAPGRWFFIYDDKNGGKGFVAFEPSEKLVAGMKGYLRGRIRGA